MSSGATSTKQNDNDSRVVGDCPEFETEGTFGRKRKKCDRHGNGDDRNDSNRNNNHNGNDNDSDDSISNIMNNHIHRRHQIIIKPRQQW